MLLARQNLCAALLLLGCVEAGPGDPASPAATLGTPEFSAHADPSATTATLTMDKTDAGWTVTAIHLDVTAQIPNADKAAFETAADNAKNGCPISRLLNAEITMDAKLA